MEVFLLNSFAKTPEGGNPAGVVLESDLTEAQMLAIAKEVGFSETAFLNKVGEKNYKIRYFTPAAEVDLCGHATIATFSLLKTKGLVEEGEYNLNTKAGEIKITITADNVFMTQILPEFSEIIPANEAAKCFGLNECDLDPNFPVQVVSTGLRDIILPVKNLETLLTMKPNFTKIIELSKKYNSVGIHAFTLETKFGAAAHCRNFAPLYDIPEESATGTASGALASYLFNHGTIEVSSAKNIIFEQGYSMDKPSEILVHLEIKDNEIASVNVGGIALLAGSKVLDIIL